MPPPWDALVPEVAAPGEHHRGADLPHGGDHLVVPPGAARLDDPPASPPERVRARVGAGAPRRVGRPPPRLERELRPVREGEERVGGERRAGEVVAELTRFLD